MKTNPQQTLCKTGTNTAPSWGIRLDDNEVLGKGQGGGPARVVSVLVTSMAEQARNTDAFQSSGGPKSIKNNFREKKKRNVAIHHTHLADTHSAGTHPAHAHTDSWVTPEGRALHLESLCQK